MIKDELACPLFFSIVAQDRYLCLFHFYFLPARREGWLYLIFIPRARNNFAISGLGSLRERYNGERALRYGLGELRGPIAIEAPPPNKSLNRS